MWRFMFFFPYKKIIPYISEASRTFLTKAKTTLPRKSCWGNYCEYKYTCTFSLFLMKLIASWKTSVSFCIFLQASLVHKRPLDVNIPGELLWQFLASRNAHGEWGWGRALCGSCTKEGNRKMQQILSLPSSGLNSGK